MAKKNTMKWLATGGLVLGVALLGGTAWATNMFTGGSTCTTINCGSRTIQGTVTQFGVSGQPWVAEVFSPNGRCFRLQVTAQGTDLEMVVRAPNGQVFRNDDSFAAPCALCPLVKIANSPNNGWYTVSLSQFAGAAASANFTMLFNTYPVGNINCAAPTAPVNSVESETKSQKNQTEVSPQQQEEGTPGAQ